MNLHIAVIQAVHTADRNTAGRIQGIDDHAVADAEGSVSVIGDKITRLSF